MFSTHFEYKASLLGPLVISHNNRRIELPASQKARNLLGFLLLHPDQPHAREQLLALLWPDTKPKAARRNLSQALWQVRQILTESMLATTSSTVTLHLDNSIQTDVRHFMETVNRHRQQKSLHTERDELAAIIPLYRGELLAGNYDDWTIGQRDKLARYRRWVLRRLIILEKKSGDLEAAVYWCDRLLEIDPLDEDAVYEMMQLCVATGQPREAAILYEQLATRLEIREWGRASSHLKQLYHSLQPASAVALPTLRVPPKREVESQQPIYPLVGRDTIFHELVQVLNDAQRGAGGLVLLDGPLGIGKSRLMHEVRSEAKWRHFDIVTVTYQQHVQRGPLAVLANAIDNALTPLRADQLKSWLDPLTSHRCTSLIPALAAQKEASNKLSDQSSNLGMVDSLIRLIVSWGKLHPLLIVMDSVQWIDSDTSLLLTKLAYALEASNVLVVVSTRSPHTDIAANLLASLAAAKVRLRYHVEPLTAEETAHFGKLLNAGKSLTPQHVETLYAYTGGNPLLIVEAMGEQTQMDQPTIVAHYETLLRKLEPPQRMLISCLAIVQHGMTLSELKATSGASAEVILSGLSALISLNLIRETVDSYQLRNALLSSLVQNSTDAQIEKRLHAAYSIWLAGAQPHAVELRLTHALHGEQWQTTLSLASELAESALQMRAYAGAQVHWQTVQKAALKLTSKQALKMRVVSAEKLLQIAIATSNQTLGNSQKHMLQQLAKTPEQKVTSKILIAEYLCIVADEYAASRELAQQSLREAEQLGLGKVAWQATCIIGHTYQRNYQSELAETWLKKAIKAWPQVAPNADRKQRETFGLAQYRLGIVHWRRGELHQAATIAQQMMEYAPNNQIVLMHYHQLMGLLSSAQDNNPQRIVHNEAAYEIAKQIGSQHMMSRMRTNLGVSYLYVPDYDRAHAVLAEAVAVNRRNKDRYGIMISLANYVDVLIRMGDLETAIPLLEEAIALCTTLRVPLWHALALTMYADCQLALGQVGYASDMLARAEAFLVGQNAPYEQAELHFSWGMLHWHKNDYAHSSASFAQAVKLADLSGSNDRLHSARAWHARCQLRQGELDNAVHNITTSTAALAQMSGKPFANQINAISAEIIEASATRSRAAIAWHQAYETLIEQSKTLSEPSAQQRFVQSVSHRRLIVEKFQHYFEKISLRLLDTKGGTGLIDCVFHLPVRTLYKSKTARRYYVQSLQREAQAQHITLSTSQLAELLSVSPRTIERDIGNSLNLSNRKP